MNASSVSDRDPIVLVSGTNEHYAMPLAVMLSSLLIHLRSPLPLKIFILSTNLSDEAKRRLRRAVIGRRPNIELTFTSVDAAVLSSYAAIKHITVDSLLRLLIPDSLPHDLEKALYLDCDLCVMKDITPLWQVDVSQLPAYASIDSAVRVVSNEWGLRNYKELGIPGNSSYFNAGVLLMNLRMWREEQIGRACLEYLKGHKTFFLDQDAINAILAGRIGVLPMTWNVNPCSLRSYSQWPDDDVKLAIAPELNTLRRSPAICHFAGGTKPWLPGLRIPFLGRWIYSLWRSRWFSPWESMLWTVQWIGMNLRALFRRKLIDPIFGATSAK